MERRKFRSGGKIPGPIRLPWKIRSGAPAGVPPLVPMMKELDPGKCPFFGPMNRFAVPIGAEVHIRYRNYEESIGSEA